MSRRRGWQSATTRAKEGSAFAGRERALSMLNAEPERKFLVSNRTTAGTIHHGLARILVREGTAEYPTYEHNGQTWRDMGAIRKRQDV